jgi:hypothetical protein
MMRTQCLCAAALLALDAYAGSAAAQFSIFGLSADLTMVIAPLARANKAAVSVEIVAKNDVDARRIYVQIHCDEVVDIESYTIPSEKNQPARTIRVKREETIADREYTLITSQKYTKGQTATVKGEIDVPPNFPPSYDGKISRVKCRARAGLDIPGNDPNSPWQEVIVH